MTSKTITIIGFGKIAIGLLYPVISSQLKPGVTFICCVRASEQWLYRRNNHSEIKACLMSDTGIEKMCVQWQFSKPNEHFSEFVERCKELQNPGIWIIENNQMLIDAIQNSTVIGTSVGIEALGNLLNTVNVLNISNVTFYAFENQPIAVRQLAKQYSNINVIHCPIDRVVVSREFDDINGSVTVKLGKDPSESIMVYDKSEIWKDILCIAEGSSLTITGDSHLLNLTLKKKLYAKNMVHKIACQIVLYKKNPLDIRNKSLCNVITSTEIQYMNDIKSALLFPAVINILSDCSTPSITAYRDVYKELSSYYDQSLTTVSQDKEDTIGRIIHLDSSTSAENDRKRLLSSLKELESVLNQNIDYNVIAPLLDELGISDFDTGDTLLRVKAAVSQHSQQTAKPTAHRHYSGLRLGVANDRKNFFGVVTDMNVGRSENFQVLQA